MNALNTIKFFDEIRESKNVLVAGAGGGFDIYSGIPIIVNLINGGKNVIVGNLSFTSLSETTSKAEFPYCYSINSSDQDLSGRNYFPEKHLKAWLDRNSISIDVFAFERIGVISLKESYKYLKKKYQIDTVILVDGGTDSLMFGDEEGLGTPQEDMCSISAVYQIDFNKRILLCLGFGIDHYHGVSHYRFLENVSELSRIGGYWGLFQITAEMTESNMFIDAIQYANSRMIGMESIVANSIMNALNGNYGDYHFNERTRNSELWINLLMTIYWCFDLEKVAKKIKYLDLISKTKTIGEMNSIISKFRQDLDDFRLNKNIPI